MNIWFGKIKTRFPVVPIMELAKLGTGHTPSRDKPEYWVDCHIPWVTVEDIRKHGQFNLRPLRETVQHISQLGLENSAAVLHPAGTVMLSRTASIGLSCITGEEMATTQAFVTWTAKAGLLEPRYLHAAIKVLKEKYEYLAYGATHLTIYFPDVKTLKIPHPPIQEQVKIANFLDYTTSKIDALIEKQEQLIELLIEKRQAVISHAVTKGIDPKVQLKSTGIQDFEEVPQDWQIVSLRRVVTLNPSKSELNAIDRSTECSFLPMEAVGEDGTLSLEKVKSIGEVESGYTYFRDGDVTIAKITPCFENGKGAVMRGLTNGIGFGTTELIVVRPNESLITSDFLYWIFSSVKFRKLAEGSMYGAGGQKRVPDDFVRNYLIGLPSLPEQSLIVDYIRKQTKKFDDLISKANEGISLLQERRFALISSAVTGQIDVNNFSADGEPA